MMLLGDLGGMMCAVLGGIGALMLPFSKFSFVLHAAGELFFAKLKENSLFSQDQDAK